MPLAALLLDFDPVLRVGETLATRWQTVALAGVLLVVLSLAGVLARRWGLRADDLLYLAIGSVPGAVLGGRIGDAVAHPEAYPGLPGALLDPAIGGLELGLGVAGGVATAAYVGVLLGAPVARWARLLAGPLLLAIGAGKLTMALGGSGQGLPLDAAWATAYLGPGPWGSAAADLPSHPAQLYEGIGTLVLGLVTLALVSGTAWSVPRRDGRALLYAVTAWALLRAVVSLTWRDAPVVGPLPAAGLLALVVALGAVATLGGILAWRSTRGTRARRAEPSWPDPETRPPF